MVKFVFWDVQHGSATYIAAPNGQHIVIDLGTWTYGNPNLKFSPLLYLKQKYGVKRLDGVIITHPHCDHLDDIFNFDELSPSVLVRPSHLNKDHITTGDYKGNEKVINIINKYLEINERYSSPIDPRDNPFDAQNNGGVEIQYFVSESCATSNLNNHSVVTIISYAQRKMIIPGDNEPPSWDELLKQKDFLSAIENADILVAPHHGRESGFSSALFKYISPRLTIISDGRFCDTSATNRYAEKTRGLIVHKRNGGTEERRCVTTRNDGVIVVEFDRQSFIKVTIN